jgi:hypothetical protein
MSNRANLLALRGELISALDRVERLLVNDAPVVGYRTDNLVALDRTVTTYDLWKRQRIEVGRGLYQAKTPPARAQ